MHDDHHDNIFNKDDTLDYLMYKECEKGVRKQHGDKRGRVGCLGLLIFWLRQ